jgi:polyferredoxin
LTARRTLPRLRRAVQVGFALGSLWAGWLLLRFVGHFTSMGETALVERPASVGGFLPIGALVALKAWITGHGFDTVHPAALVIFLAAVAVSLVVARSFCSWVCPIGLLHELLGGLGRKLFRRRIDLPRWADIPLRGVKYLLLAFFLISVFVGMSGEAAAAFLDSSYYKIIDVRMLRFFLDPSRTTLIVLGGLGLAAVVVPQFWCRYLCPYGALLGVVGRLTPLPVTRREDACVGCRACSRACPGRIDVATATAVRSAECIGCLDCVAACPHAGALSVELPALRRPVPAWLSAAVLLATFAAVIAAGMLTGHWRSEVDVHELAMLLWHQVTY